jgi:riboflavin synthase
LGGLTARTAVNLELALRLNDRLGGHLVLGHVDGVGIVKTIEKKETSWLFAIEIPQQFLKYVIPVGSIAIDGVSLTVARIEGNVVTVSIIPHTFENTTFQYFSTGSKVNLEFDLIGKYIERLVGKDAPDQITADKLRMWGYSE